MKLLIQPKQLLPLFIALLLLIGFGLRLLYLEQYPLAVNQDELSNIYDGYSILETGADRWGQHFPVILKGFGNLDYRPPLYAWLSAATIQVFGFSVASGRLVSALLGCASLVLLYLVAKRMGGTLFAFFALLLVTLSPWHLLFSRLASEGTMPPFFVICACYLWQRAREAAYKPSSVALLGFCIGLGTNTYQAGKVIFFLFAILCLLDMWQWKRNFFVNVLIFGILCLLGAAPQLVALITMPTQFFSRATSTAGEYSFSFDYFNTFFRSVTSYAAPEFLFFSFKSYNNLSIGRLLMVEFLPFYIGLFFIYKILNRNQVIKLGYFYALLFIVVLPSVLTNENPHALRSASLTVLLPLVTAAGIVVIYRYFSTPWLKQAFVIVAAGLIVWNGIFFLKTYVRSADLRSQNMQVLLVKAAKRINDSKKIFENIYIDNTGNQPYIYVLTFCDVKPQEFQHARIKNDSGDWDNVKQINNYYFLNRDEINEKLKTESAKTLVVMREKVAQYQLIDSVEHQGEKMYFYAHHGEQ